MSENPSALEIPYEKLGGEANVRALVERFYDAMEEHEPELAALHPMVDGKIIRASRDRFALFLIGWLGGPEEYVRLHGHPRLRMRHAAAAPPSTFWRRTSSLAKPKMTASFAPAAAAVVWGNPWGAR
jgi:hemoglobin